MTGTIVSIATRVFKLLIISREGWEAAIPYGRTSRKRPLKMPTRIRPHNRRKICWDIVLNREDFKERKTSTPLPCPLHSMLGCLLFSWGSSNSGTTLRGGDGKEKAIFPLFEVRKTSKIPFRTKWHCNVASTTTGSALCTLKWTNTNNHIQPNRECF